MRIKRHQDGAAARQLLKSQIASAALGKTVKGRVCGDNCTLRCPQCGSASCQCKCSPYCADAPRALSTEGDVYPVEPAVVSLVYEMKRPGVYEPCWSCEGHLGADGKLTKLPQLWFYCDSMVHVRLLASTMAKLKYGGHLSAAWHVVVTYSDPDNPQTTFSLELAAAQEHELTLPALHKDLAEMARLLHGMIAGEAQNLQRDAKKALNELE